jgi:hypothetical protein
MKTLIAFLLFTLFSVSANAQRVWEKDGKYPFTGTISRSTIWETITRSFFSTISFQIVEFPRDSSMHLNVKVNLKRHNFSRKCFDDSSKILITSGDILITINLLGSAGHGSILTNYGNILSGDIEFLRHNLFDMVRVYFADGYNDYTNRNPLSEVPSSKYNKSKDFKSDYFIRTLKHFE